MLKLFFNRYFVPIVLIVLCPPFVMLIWYMNVVLEGSFIVLFDRMRMDFWGLLSEAWFVRFWGSAEAWGIVGVFVAAQLVFMKFIPGKMYRGTPTPMGHVPVYRDNGLTVYLLSFVLFLGGSIGLGWFDPAVIYHHFGELLAVLNLVAICFCVLLLVKGYFFPSSPDCNSSGNVVFDYYWGRELHPNILGWDVKMFTNCRFGMIGWALTVTSFLFANIQQYGQLNYGMCASVVLIDLYLLKFFIWERGYMRSMDIAVDRAGFYICWGCLVWVLSVYTSPILFMVNHPSYLPAGGAVLLFVAGCAAIGINFWADYQRQHVREEGGRCMIWGRAPKLIKASYRDARGEQKTNLLLVSGFWGISRHFHYVPELVAAFLWSCAAGFMYFTPFFYVVFLGILLVHRSYRDEEKCRRKYGPYWTEYKELVPYRLIPYVF